MAVAIVIVTFGILSAARLSQDCCADARAGTRNGTPRNAKSKIADEFFFTRVPLQPPLVFSHSLTSFSAFFVPANQIRSRIIHPLKRSRRSSTPFLRDVESR